MKNKYKKWKNLNKKKNIRKTKTFSSLDHRIKFHFATGFMINF